MNAALQKDVPEELACRILVVEDDPTVMELLEACFNGRLLTASSIGEAKRNLRKDSPDLVILDRVLPDGDGVSFCEEVRNDPEHGGIPVLLLTCKAGSRDIVEGLRLGADDYLTKPYDVAELQARIEALLRRTEQLRPGRKFPGPLWKY